MNMHAMYMHMYMQWNFCDDYMLSIAVCWMECNFGMLLSLDSFVFSDSSIAVIQWIIIIDNLISGV